ncbi:MAG: class F420-dependent oxidoreductase [Frankiales bacterium]|nr:class F420-dependent oxidoreductase [Frankiales bacterium]
MAHPMTDEQARAFLAHGTRTAKLATTRPDGRPHVAPVWFVLDGGDLLFLTGKDTVKGKSLAHDPRVAIVVDLEETPYAFVLVEGVAELSEDLAAMLPVSIEIARRYMGDEQAQAFGERNAVPGELLVRVRPSKIVALDDLTA